MGTMREALPGLHYYKIHVGMTPQFQGSLEFRDVCSNYTCLKKDFFEQTHVTRVNFQRLKGLLILHLSFEWWRL